MAEGILVEHGFDISGTTADRPTNAPIGARYYNTDTNTQQVVSAAPSGVSTWADSADYGTQSNTAGDGFDLSVTGTAMGVFTDDGGNSLDTIDNARGIRSRMLLTVDQDGSSLRAIQGQLKVLDTVDFSTGIYTAVQGYVELAGDTSAETGSTLSCFDASLEIASAKTLTIDSGGEACGIHVETTGAGTITNSGTCAAILISNASGAPDWPVGIDLTASCATGIDIGNVTASGITFTGTMLTGINFEDATLSPNTGRTNHALMLGGRSTEEIAVAFAGGAGAENFEPVQMNFNLTGTNPASTSTINIIQQALYHDTNDMANLRLKCADWLVTVDKDCTDVYCIQNEIAFGAGTNTVSGEVAVLGLVLDGGAGSLTNSAWRVINCTLRGAGTPSNSAGIFINQESGCGTVDAGIRVEASATMTSAFRIGAPEFDNTPTHLFQFPADATSPIDAGNFEVHGGTKVRISCLVGGAQYYMLASTAPTTQS